MAFMIYRIYNSLMPHFIEFVDVEKSFAEKKVLDGVSFRVEEGETFAILGPSGAGKTVTLTLAVGLLKPDRGRIIVDGEDITEMDERELAHVRRNVQLVFQSGALFDSLTIQENVAFPLSDSGYTDEDIDNKVEEYLKLVEIEDLADLMPSELSTGMKRAVAIARAVAAQPEAILYDEPTTMVDPLMSQTINKLIRKMQKQLGMTQMVVTHDIATVRRKSRIAWRCSIKGSLFSWARSTNSTRTTIPWSGSLSKKIRCASRRKRNSSEWLPSEVRR